MLINIAGRFVAAHRRAQGHSVEALAERTGAWVRVATIEAWEQGQRPASHALLANLLWVAGALDLSTAEQDRLVGAVQAERFLEAVLTLPSDPPVLQVLRVFAPLLPSRARYWLARVFRHGAMDVWVDGEPARLEVATHHLALLRDRFLAASRALLGAFLLRPPPDSSAWVAARQSWQWLARSLVSPVPAGALAKPGPPYLQRFSQQRVEATDVLRRAYQLALAQQRHETRRDIALALYQGHLDRGRTGSSMLAHYLGSSSDDPWSDDAAANLAELSRLAGDGSAGPAVLALLVTLLADLRRDEEPLALVLTLRTVWQCLSRLGSDAIPLDAASEQLHELVTATEVAALPRAQEIRALLAQAAAVRFQRYGAGGRNPRAASTAIPPE